MEAATRRLRLQLFHNLIVVFFPVGKQAAGAILNAVFRVSKIAAAAIAQGIQRTVAEHTVKAFLICALMAGEIFAGGMLKELIIVHINHLSKSVPRENVGGLVCKG